MDDNSGVDSVSYLNRADWKDVSPIFLNDPESAVVNIAYSERCKSFGKKFSKKKF